MSKCVLKSVVLFGRRDDPTDRAQDVQENHRYLPQPAPNRQHDYRRVAVEQAKLSPVCVFASLAFLVMHMQF